MPAGQTQQSKKNCPNFITSTEVNSSSSFLFRRARIGRHLWCGAIVAILLSCALAASILLHAHQIFAQARQNARLLLDLHLVLEAANRISSERAPSNILMDSDADALADARVRLQGFRADTDRALQKVQGHVVPAPLLREVGPRLTEARWLIDLTAMQATPHYGDVQRAIDAMFAAYDAFQEAVAWQASQLIQSDPSLQGPVLRALALCDLRDAAGRLGSHLVAPLASRTRIPPRNLEDRHRTDERVAMQWRLLELDDNPASGKQDMARLQADARVRFTNEGLPLIDMLLAEGERGTPYSLTPTAFTKRYSATLTPLETWRRIYLDQLVADYQDRESKAFVLFVVVLASALVIVGLITGIVLLVQLRVLRPLLEASEAVIGLVDERPVTLHLRHHSAKELQVLFNTLDVLKAKLQERADLTRRLKAQAETDELTGLLNRRAFMALGKPRLTTTGKRVFLILLDLDHFKSINDRHGHPTGDRVLVAVADALRGNVRPGDLVARLGGEEFAILLQAREPTTVLSRAQRLRTALRNLELTTPDGESILVTASFGIAEGSQRTWRQLLAEADVALYAAKHTGRDCIRLSETDTPATT